VSDSAQIQEGTGAKLQVHGRYPPGHPAPV
jgi:hypothetical protein